MDCEQISSIPDFAEAILALEDSEEATIIVEDKKKMLDGLTLKELPKNLHYVFFYENGTKPIIISTTLNEEMEHMILEVLRRNKEGICVVN